MLEEEMSYIDIMARDNIKSMYTFIHIQIHVFNIFLLYIQGGRI